MARTVHRGSHRLALDDENGVVQFLAATEQDIVLGLAIRNDAVPVTFDQLRKLLERLESLPPECVFPFLEELPGQSFDRAVPQLPEAEGNNIRCNIYEAKH